MEKYPTIIEFDREHLYARMSGIKADEAKRAELQNQLYELDKQKFEIEKQMGIKSKEPRAPYVQSDRVEEWMLEQKASVLGRVAKVLEFGQDGRVDCVERDADEGIGFESKTKFKYEVQEGALCIAAIVDHRQFGWSSSGNELRTQSTICAPEMEFPLRSKHATSGPLETYGRTSWNEAGYAVGDLLKALRWRRALDRMTKLIDEKGVLVILEGREPRFNSEVKRVRIEDETETWMIQLGDMWQSYNASDQEISAPFRVTYENKIIDQGFGVEMKQDNIRPYILRDGKRTVTRENHMDYVEKIIDRIEELSA